MMSIAPERNQSFHSLGRPFHAVVLRSCSYLLSGIVQNQQTLRVHLLGFLLLLLISCKSLAEPQETNSQSRSEAIAATLATAFDAIQSYDVYFSVKPTWLIPPPIPPQLRNITPKPASTNLQPKYYRQVGQNGMIRSEHISSRPGQSISGISDTWIWNGNQAKSLGGTRGVVSTTSLEVPPPGSFLYENLFRTILYTTKLPSLIRTRPSDCLTWTHAHSDLKIHLKRTLDKNAPLHAIALSLVLDSEKGFLPKLIEYQVLDNGKMTPWIRFETTYFQARPGLWVPNRSTQSLINYKHNEESFGKVISTNTIEIDEARSRFNTPIGQGEFEIQFPIGTEVDDRTKNTTYRVGAENKRQYLDRLAVRGRLSVEQLKNRQSRDVMGTTISNPWWKRAWLIIPSLVLVLVLAIFFYFKTIFRSNRKQGTAQQ